ncbi:GNAT family N-acetyltransferase [Parabacteroides bouchesdurhonensis]|uniref:GNAT family N-acetyltransferase n=1 Tax=Parabacteroides bouchesdurhonensis TaxID=1936995 RepID=UPI000C861A94|nr:GNAT family N-acetyltransferase [Parabacteroides bouchesdurhonensis]
MFSIKKATVDDSSTIHSLASRTWSDTYGNILSKEQLEYMFDMMYAPENILKQMNELHHQYFIIYNNGEPSGYLSIEKKEDGLFNFQKIYSLPEIHGSGIGRYIIEQGIAYLKNTYPTPFTIELYVNRHNPAVGFYKHMGFKEVATRDHHIGNGYYMNDYIMEIRIDD